MFQDFLHEKECLFVYKPTLAHNPQTYKYVRSAQKVCFNSNTMVSKCYNFDGPEHGFDFVNFHTILENQVDATETIDVIGYVVGNITKEMTPVKTGNESQRMNLLLEDLENRQLNVTLWGEYADKLINYVQNNPTDSILVIILQFAKVKNWQGTTSVTNSFFAAKLFINDDIEDINSFKKRLLAQSVVETSSSQRGFGSSIVSSVEDEFLNKIDFSFISDITDVTSPKYLIVLGTIKAICTELPWFYQGCKKCNKKVGSMGVSILKSCHSGDGALKKRWECENNDCDEQILSAVNTRFKIPIRVQDSTGVVTLTLFDRDAIKLLKITAEELLDNSEKIIPKELNVLLDKKFAFKIEISNFNLEKNFEFYTISKLTSDISVMCHLENKFEVGQHVDFQSISVIDLENRNAIKDSVSYVGDNVTPPFDVEKSAKAIFVEDASPSEASSIKNLKRNLECVYDVDGGLSESSTKPNSKEKKNDGREDGKYTLIISKIEK